MKFAHGKKKGLMPMIQLQRSSSGCAAWRTVIQNLTIAEAQWKEPKFKRVTVLHRLEGSPAVTGANNFTDVKNGEWYTNAVIWANANDIVSGYGNGLFGTNDPITREQMAAILYRYAGYKGYDVTAAANLSAYTDAADISGWAEKAMRWANAEGLITGRTTTTLVSGGTATRAEVASILNRFVEGFVE